MPRPNRQFDKYRTVVSSREARHECDQQQPDRHAPARPRRPEHPRRATVATRARDRSDRQRRLHGGPAFVTGARRPSSPSWSGPAPRRRSTPCCRPQIGFSAGTMTTIFGVYALTLLATLLVTGLALGPRRPPPRAGRRLRRPRREHGRVLARRRRRDADGLAGRPGRRRGTADVDHVRRGRRPRAPRPVPAWPRPSTASPRCSASPPARCVAGAALDATPARPADRLRDPHRAPTSRWPLGVLALPETSPRHEGWRRSLRPQVGIPAAARPAFRRSAPALVRRLGHRWPLPLPGCAHRRPAARRPQPRRAGRRRHRRSPASAPSAPTSAGAARPAQITLYGTTMLAVGTLLTLVALHAESLVALPAGRRGRGLGLRHVVPRDHALDHARRSDPSSAASCSPACSSSATSPSACLRSPPGSPHRTSAWRRPRRSTAWPWSCCPPRRPCARAFTTRD